MIVKKCPHCDNNIRIHPIKFPVINDKGGIVVECSQCNKFSFCDTINPEETGISKGGKKIDTWDVDITTREKALSKYPNIKELREGVLVIGDLEEREYEFNFNNPHIYHCSKCGNEVENTAKIALDNESRNITE